MTEEYGSPGLREKLVDIICEEWRNRDNGIEVATIFERLQSEGVEASKRAVRDELVQMANDGDIQLATPPNNLLTGDTTVRVFRQELCE
jgi:hypothetical protein